MNIKLDNLYKALHELVESGTSDPTRFFKTGTGSYSEHDRFLPITNPDLRKLVKSYRDLSDEDIIELLSSVYNQYRLLALFILVEKYQKGTVADKNHIYKIFIDHIDQVNNWNLVDSCAHLIVGAHVHAGLANSVILEKLVVSPVLWHRRIGIVATWYHIRQGSFDMTLLLANRLLQDQHDLMHKAVGWMLREVGKKDEFVLRQFLEKYGKSMPRTMWRYAIERLSDI